MKDNKVAWQGPSNIALVKYWGKKAPNLPANPSISFTLKHSYSEMEIEYLRNKSNFKIEFLFNGKPNPTFAQRLNETLNNLFPHFPFLHNMHLKISSTNSFPHSAGIASSASSMSALSLCLCSIKEKIDGEPLDFTAASNIARLCSGSASRSILGGWNLWGKCESIQSSCDEYAISLNDMIHPTFENIHDAILVVDSSPKTISSSQGHSFMHDNPFAPPRYQEANRHIKQMIGCLKLGKWENFGALVEKEAYQLHAMMMLSSPPFSLLKGKTVAVMEKIQQYRKKSGNDLYFTLDAGANVHLIYPQDQGKQIKDFILNDLINLTVHGEIIFDEMGSGPLAIESMGPGR